MNLAQGFFRALAWQVAKVVGYIALGACVVGLIIWGITT